MVTAGPESIVTGSLSDEGTIPVHSQLGQVPGYSLESVDPFGNVECEIERFASVSQRYGYPHGFHRIQVCPVHLVKHTLNVPRARTRQVIVSECSIGIGNMCRGQPGDAHIVFAMYLNSRVQQVGLGHIVHQVKGIALLGLKQESTGEKQYRPEKNNDIFNRLLQKLKVRSAITPTSTTM